MPDEGPLIRESFARRNKVDEKAAAVTADAEEAAAREQVQV